MQTLGQIEHVQRLVIHAHRAQIEKVQRQGMASLGLELRPLKIEPQPIPLPFDSFR